MIGMSILKNFVVFILIFGTTEQTSSSNSDDDTDDLDVHLHLQERALPRMRTADEVCQETLGNRSYLCRTTYSTGYNYVCSSMYCYDAVHDKCVFHTIPPDRTICGNKKWCVRGSCIHSEAAPETSDSCPLGDTLVLKNGQNCTGLVEARSSSCYDLLINNTWCCDTCPTVDHPTPDRFTGPARSPNDQCVNMFGSKSSFCRNDYSGSYESICRSMSCYDDKIGQCVSLGADDGTPCAPGKWCVGGVCVQSSSAPVDPVNDCFYGDAYPAFCQTNIQYPNVALYCTEQGYFHSCCSTCKRYANESNPSCKYGDKKPDDCKKGVEASSFSEYCSAHDADCCDTCGRHKNASNPNCPYGDKNSTRCKTLMTDTLGPGNCYNYQNSRDCCVTCPKYYNASHSGCEYGDYWKDYCATNSKGTQAANLCVQHQQQCCGTCTRIKSQSFPGCELGDRDSDYCDRLIHNSTLREASCYDIFETSRCCLTCHNIENKSMPGCEYGDRNPAKCKEWMKDDVGTGHCYQIVTQSECCRTCGQLKNESNAGCEYGNRYESFCSSINATHNAFLCYQGEDQCCAICREIKNTTNPICPYGDRDPVSCGFDIYNAATAQRMCPTRGMECCATCATYTSHAHAGVGAIANQPVG